MALTTIVLILLLGWVHWIIRWVGLGWMSTLVGWVGLGLRNWTHELCIGALCRWREADRQTNRWTRRLVITPFHCVAGLNSEVTRSRVCVMVRNAQMKGEPVEASQTSGQQQQQQQQQSDLRRIVELNSLLDEISREYEMYVSLMTHYQCHSQQLTQRRDGMTSVDDVSNTSSVTSLSNIDWTDSSQLSPTSKRCVVCSLVSK